MEEIRNDARFKHIARDPRFRRMKRKDRKVKIDKRFKGMFNDNRFKLKYTVDKRGRPIHATTNENLRKFYDVSGSGSSDSENSDDSDDDSTNKKEKMKKSNDKDTGSKKSQESRAENTSISDIKKSGKGQMESVKMSEDESNGDASAEPSGSEDNGGEDESGGEEEGSEEEAESSDIDIAGGPDFARGEGNLESSSDDTDEEDDRAVKPDAEVEHPWGEIDHDAPETDDVSCRLAICNMDWDRIQAADLMVLFNSFKPQGGVIKTVTIYPSEFGLQRMAEEEVKGPTELVAIKGTPDQDNDAEYHREKLRKYQLNRLKYYYAVVECDSPETANHIYEQCDGIEYEGSATKMDLRFVPDDMTFDQEPKSHVTDMPDSASYKPSRFINSALQQSKVNLTWDETDHNRMAVTMRKFTKEDLDTLDVKDYLASDSDEGVYGDRIAGSDCGEGSDNEDEETQINKYRALLQGLDDGEKAHGQDMEMEVTWEPGLKEATQDLVNKSKMSAELTPWEKYLEKNKEKKIKKQEKKKKKKDLKDDEDPAFSDDDVPEGVDLNDPFFAEEIQPTKDNPKKKDTKKKKKKKIKEESEKDDKDKAELSLLMLDEEKDEKKHFNLRDIMEGEKPLKGRKKRRMRKRKQLLDEERARIQEQDDFTINVEDDRFRELYQNPLFNLDPTAPEFKKTKAMETVIEEKLRRRIKKHKQLATEGNDSCDITNSKKVKLDEESKQNREKDPALASLIKSVKAKTKTIQSKKKKSKGGLG